MDPIQIEMMAADLSEKEKGREPAMLGVLTSMALNATMHAYTVKSGDSLWKISQATGVSISVLAKDNGIQAPYALSVGQTIEIPVATNGNDNPSQTTTPTPNAAHTTIELQQTLATLEYLPLTQDLQWKYADVPPSLKALWLPGNYNEMTKGAVMQFQSDNGLVIDGIAGPQTWAALANAMTNNLLNEHGYTFVYVSNTAPFTMDIWHDGAYVLMSLANLGIPQSQTVTGTYPVYKQYLSKEMRGINPDGTAYDDPGVQYVSYFHNGEAIHAYPRISYGSQQSLGCVELPLTVAQQAWTYIHIGTLVTIDK